MLPDVREHGGCDLGVDGRRGVVIEIDRFHKLPDGVEWGVFVRTG